MRSIRTSSGGDVDRDAPLQFWFEGRTLHGLRGDTLASALLANNVEVIGRSFKYHRPRGLLAAGVEEPNALMQIGVGAAITTNVRATEVELTEGLVAKPVNCWPSARFDVGALNSLFAPFIPAGFYYKTFMWPDWSLFEPFIRRAAGLGRPSSQADPGRYETVFAHTDIIIIGSGAAGLAGARCAAQSGARIMLVEQDPLLGGALRWREQEVDAMSSRHWVGRTEAELLAHGVEVRTRTCAIGYFDHNEIVLVENLVDAPSAQRLWRVRAKQVILATGAIERPLVFPGNDRPGIMLASGVHRYLGQYGVRAGERIALFTNNDDAYGLAHAYQQAGGIVACIIDTRGAPSKSDEYAARMSGFEVIEGEIVTTRGTPALKSIKVAARHGETREFDVDVLAMSGGWSPSVHLFKQSGGALFWDDAQVSFRPAQSVQPLYCAGAANGAFDLGSCLQHGHDAAAAALAALGRNSAIDAPRTAQRPDLAIKPHWRTHAKGKAWVDWQNDVTVGDIELAHREGFVSVEHLKRYTTLGMAPDQGKTANVNALAIMADLRGLTIPEVGTTAYRFPFTPTSLAVFAGRDRGRLFRPLRHLPARGAHERLGAVLEEYGGWARPAYYPKAGETAHEAEQREALAVRQAAGVFDASPLGKIEIKGPDAATFIDRIYANTMSTLRVGKLRYGIMLNEFGVVIDDGVAARMAGDHFLIGATSAGAERMAAWLEEWLQCEWSHLDVIVAPMTTATGVIALSGPRARDILRALDADPALVDARFAHMSFRDGAVAGERARVARVSFTGEASFEINVPWNRTEALWEKLLAVDRKLGLTPVGVDAWMLLRTEKGYLHIGSDTDGVTTALDLGWRHVLARKSDFIGRRSLTRTADAAPDRFQFVALEAVDGSSVLEIGAHMRKPGADGASEGYITSSGFSPVLRQGVALGMVRGGQGRLNEEFELYARTGRMRVRIVAPGAYDPEGIRLND